MCNLKILIRQKPFFITKQIKPLYIKENLKKFKILKENKIIELKVYYKPFFIKKFCLER